MPLQSTWLRKFQFTQNPVTFHESKGRQIDN